MLNDVEQNNNVETPKLGESGFIGNAGQDRQAALPTERGGIVGDFKPLDVVVWRRFLQEKAVSAAELEKASRRAAFANEPERASEFAPQNRLSIQVIGVTVGPAPGKVLTGVIPRWIEVDCRSVPQAAGRALQDFAAVFDEQGAVFGRYGACWTG